MLAPASTLSQPLVWLEALFDAHHRHALGYAYRLVRNRSDAEDVVQEAFLSAWRARAVYDPRRGSERTWLLTLVRNHAINLLRARGRRPVSPGDELHTVADQCDVAEDVALRLDGAAVRLAFSGLPTPQRQALELAYFGGMSHTEIATRLDEPVGTVKGRIRLGLGRLRITLATSPAMSATADGRHTDESSSHMPASPSLPEHHHRWLPTAEPPSRAIDTAIAGASHLPRVQPCEAAGEPPIH